MKLVLLACLWIFISGCATLYGIASTNSNNLAKIREILSPPEDKETDKEKTEMKALTKEEVLKIMGTETQISGLGDFFTSVKNPYKIEILVDDQGQKYEVLYYLTDIARTTRWEKRRITGGNLTPLVFKDSRLVGYGWGFLGEKSLIKEN